MDETTTINIDETTFTRKQLVDKYEGLLAEYEKDWQSLKGRLGVSDDKVSLEHASRYKNEYNRYETKRMVIMGLLLDLLR